MIKNRRWNMKSTLALLLAGVMLIGETVGVRSVGVSTVYAAEDETGVVITSMDYYSVKDGPVIVAEGVRDVSYGFVMPKFNGGAATWADVVKDLHVKVKVDGVYKNIDDVTSFQYNTNWGHWHDGGADGYWFKVSETTEIQLYSKANENVTLNYTLQLNKLSEYDLTSITIKNGTKEVSVTGGSGIDKGTDLLYNADSNIKFSQIEATFNEDVEIQVKRASETEFVPLFDNAAAGWIYDSNFGVYTEGNGGWWFNNLEESITVRFHSKSNKFADADIQIIYTEPERSNYTLSAADGITTFDANNSEVNKNHEAGIYPGLPMIGGTSAVKSDLEKFVYEVYDNGEWKPMGDVWLYRENGYSNLSAKTQWGYSVTAYRYELWIRPVKEDAQVRIGYPTNGQVGGDIGDNYVYYTFIGDPNAAIPDVSDMGKIEIDNMHTDGDVTQVTAPEGWNLIWNDEFNGTTLNEANWTKQTGYLLDENDIGTYGWGNKELEYYTDSEKNTSVSNGKLNLTLLKEEKIFYEKDDPTQSATAKYSSGKVISQNKFAVKYGRVDFRAKLPDGVGIWPALWMMPNKDIYGTWARSGEIDIMEGRGRVPDIAFGTLHYGDYWPNDDEDGLTMSMSEYELDGDMTNWHVYSMIWEEDNIKIYCDGICYYKGTNNLWFSAGDPSNNNAPFDQQFYLIMNLAAGGYFDGLREPEDSVTRKDMYVDYVRVYQKNAEEGDPDDDGDGLYGDYLVAVKVPLEEMTLDKTSISISAGDSEKITPSFEPVNATNKNITWTSSDESIATVSDGVVTAIKPGSVTVTAVAEDGKITKTCEVTITGEAVTEVAVTPITLELTEGENGTLTATVTGTNQNVTWSSSAANVVTVDENGNVTAKAEGTATITVISVADSTKSATCTVKVNAKPPVEVTGVTIKNGNDESGEVTVEEGSSVTLTAIVAPSDATDKSVTWTSGNNAVAIVDANGKVTAVAEGNTTITATSKNGKADTWTVIVTKKSTERGTRGAEIVGNDIIFYTSGNANVPFYKILDSADVTIDTTQVGAAGTLTVENGYRQYTIVDGATQYADKYLAYWFDDGQGITTVKVSEIPSVEGENPVTKPVESVSITNVPTDALKIGDILTLRASVLPFDATEDRRVTWKSSNTNVATVEETTGKVTAVGAGETIITVTANARSEVSASCTIEVVETIDSKELYQVDFKINDSVTSVEVEEGEKVEKPEDPSIEGYAFEGWYEGDTEFNFETPITKDTILVAKLTKIVTNVSVTGVTLNKSKTTLEVGANETLTATVEPATATDKEVTWTSSETEVAEVDASGKVTAKAIGTTRITVATKDGDCKASCEVTVIAKEDDNNGSGDNNSGDTNTYPEDNNSTNVAKEYKVTFDSADGTAVASQTVKEGEKAAKPEDPARTGYRFLGWYVGETEYSFDTAVNTDVTLTAKWEVIKITKIKVTAISNKIAVGKKVQLKVSLSPTDAVAKSVTWKLAKKSDNKYATVKSNGNITLKKKGAGKSVKVKVTVTGLDGTKKTKTLKISIKKHAVKKLAVKGKKTYSVKAGRSINLKSKVKITTTGKSVNKTLKWTTSDKAIATVSKNGKVKVSKTAKKGQRVKIKVQSTDGTNKKVTFTIKVK